MDSEKGFSFYSSRDAGSLDLSDVPQFQSPKQTIRDVISTTIVDIGLMILYIIVVFAGSFVSFLRYDVR